MTYIGVDISTGEFSKEFEDAQVQFEPLIRFKIRYPLTNPKSIELMHSDGSGWSKRQLAEAVCQEYKTIYAEEHAAVGDPGHIQDMDNRNISRGPWGIWGHDIADLWLSDVDHLDDGSWRLCISS